MSFQTRSHVLIIYADTGSGHRSVALAIHSALSAMSPDACDTAAMTPISESAPNGALAPATLHNPVEHHLLGRLFGLYGPVTRHAPRLFASAYHISNSERVCNLAGRITYRLLHKHLARLVDMTQPDLIVCVHSLLTHPVLQVLRRGNYGIPLFSVVTDLTSIHQSWIVPDVDLCFVPTAEARDEMISRGMSSERLRLSGLPVHPNYISAPDYEGRDLLRLALNLRPEPFTVLIMGGGEGVGKIGNIAHHLAGSHLPMQLIVVAGRNLALYEHLRKQQHAWRMPHRVVGFAHNVPDLMRAADVVVTKAGSVTIAESLACGLPIILSSVIEGQESGNVDFLTRHGVGCLAQTTEDILEAVRSLRQLDEHTMRDLRSRARRLSIPAAAFDIASHILAALERTSEAAIKDTRNGIEPILV